MVTEQTDFEDWPAEADPALAAIERIRAVLRRPTIN
jgi:hypothetical protein